MKRTEFSSALLGERYVRYDHESGMPIYIFPKKLTTTYALFATRYGSIHTRLQVGEEVVTHPPGIAHFLEHKLFENQDGSDAFSAFSALGVDANAYTSYQQTAYLISCTENFHPALCELIRFVLTPHFTEASVKKEQGIIAEEIRMYEDIPGERCIHRLLSAMYHSHPVRDNICGSEASIKEITPRLLYRACEWFYQPYNMALVIAGDVDEEETARVAAEALARFRPSGVRVSLAAPAEPETVKCPFTTCRMQVTKPMFAIGIKDPVIPADPEERTRRDAAMELLDEILFSRSGEFYNRLLEEGLISPGFGGGYSCTDQFAYHCISGESDDPHEVLRRVKEYIREKQRTGIDGEDLERTRRVLYADEIRAYDSTEEIANRLLAFVFDGADLFAYPHVIQSITKDELDHLLRTCYGEELFALSTVTPME